MNFRLLVRAALASAVLSTASFAHITILPLQSGTAASGTATLEAVLDDTHECAHIGHLAFAAASLSLLPPPGIPLPGGAALLIPPDPAFNITSAAWGVSTVEPFCSALFPAIPLPASAAGLQLFLQGITLNPVTFVTESSAPAPHVIT